MRTEKAGRRVGVGDRAATVGASRAPARPGTTDGGYARATALPALVPLWGIAPDGGAEATAAICRALAAALRRERRRADRRGEGYDPARHLALRRALDAELDRLAAERRVSRTQAGTQCRHALGALHKGRIDGIVHLPFRAFPP